MRECVEWNGIGVAGGGPLRALGLLWPLQLQSTAAAMRVRAILTVALTYLLLVTDLTAVASDGNVV